MKVQQLTFNPCHPKPDERQQQLQFFASTLKKSKIYLIWSKMRIPLMKLQATLQTQGDFYRVLPKKVVFPLSQPKQDLFSLSALPLRKKNGRNIGRHREAAQLSKKYRNIKVDQLKIVRPNPIETETAILEDPLPERKTAGGF